MEDNFELAKQKSLDKWRNIESSLKDSLRNSSSPCGFCIYYDCNACPASKICFNSLHKGVMIKLRELNDLLPKLVKKIDALKE